MPSMLASPPSSGPNSVQGSEVIANTRNMMTSPNMTSSIRLALKHVYEHIWVTFVVRSPLYHPSNPDIRLINFESALDNYFKGMPWFR
jgi:hypothetical protein